MSDIIHQLSVNPKQEITLAHQLKQQLAWLVTSGALKAGDTLPALRLMAEHLAINLHTVRSAYHMLEVDGLVEIHQGREARVLAFDPRRVALSAAAIRTHTVGVIVPSLFNPFYHALLQGVSEEADLVQTLLFVCNSREDPAEAWRYYFQLAAHQVDGIIIASHHLEGLGSRTPGPNQTQLKTLPVVGVDTPEFEGPAVVLDLERAGYQATQHLIQHGHRRIGLITYFSDLDNVLPVNAGYRRALQEAGIPKDPALSARVKGFDIASGAEGAQALISMAHPPTAIFAITDLLAAGALQALREKKYRVPQDMALIGFNDIPLAALLDPPLTSVAAPALQMGKAAMRMLQNLIEGKNLSQMEIKLPTSLVERQSCGDHILR